MQRLALSLLALLTLTACLEEELQEQPLEATDAVTITARQTRDGILDLETQPVTLAAYQQGDGPWQPMTLQNGTYTATVAPGRYAVAMGQRNLSSPSNEYTDIQIKHATTDETHDPMFFSPFTFPEPYRLVVDVRGVDVDERAVIAVNGGGFLGYDNGQHALASSRRFVELFVILRQRSSGSSPRPEVPLKVFRLVNVDLLGTPQIVVDFNLPLAAPLAYPVAFGSASSGMVNSYVRTPSGAVLLGRSPNTFYALPSSIAYPTDIISASASTPSMPGTPVQSTYNYPLSAGPLLLHYGTVNPAPAPVAIQTPYIRPSFLLPQVGGELPFTDYTYQFFSDAIDDNASIATLWTFYFTDGWVRDATSSRYDAPVFAGLPGWTSEMAPLPRTMVSWSASVAEQNVRGIQPGRIVRSTTTFGSIGEYCGNGVVELGWETCDPPNGVTCSERCSSL